MTFAGDRTNNEEEMLHNLRKISNHLENIERGIFLFFSVNLIGFTLVLIGLLRLF
ncbi:MAG: hypothetical protein GF309_08770 [Candidatus Lokiarchaeota archaeon]|nr:hypothetical protein [Candidatus Lokiarchaeota archaeon]